MLVAESRVPVSSAHTILKGASSLPMTSAASKKQCQEPTTRETTIFMQSIMRHASACCVFS